MASPYEDRKTVIALMTEKLAESGIKFADAPRLRMRPLLASEVLKLYPTVPNAGTRPAIEITYCDFKGKPTPAVRLRFLGVFTDFGKDTRYAQPKGSKVAVLWPPVTPWEKLIADPEVPLYFTEGEFKAFKANLCSFPCVGLGGVRMFGGKESRLHPDLLKVKWTGRPTYIVFDSDAVGNPNVRMAELALVRALRDAGAVPAIVRLPELVKGAKTALDDFLVAKGKAAFARLVENAVPDKATEALQSTVEEFLYVNQADVVLDLKHDDFKMNSDKFKNSHYKNRRYIETVVNSKGDEKPVEKETAVEFMRWKDRPQVQNFTFLPGRERIVGSCYNLWKGRPYEPVKGGVELWHRLIAYVFAGKSKEEVKYFEQWVAYPIQNPGAKLMQAVLLWGLPGSGKSYIGEIIGRLYAPHSVVFKNQQLSSEFNGWVGSKEFGLGEEIVVNTVDRGEISELLKTMITGKTITINEKYLKPYDLPNFMNIMIVSNHSVVLKIEREDRRYFIVRTAAGQMAASMYDALNEWSFTKEGLSALYYYFMNLSLTGFDPNGPAMRTSDRESMVEHGSSNVEAWVYRLKVLPDETLRLGNRNLPYKLWSAEDLLKLYKDAHEDAKASVSYLSSNLISAGFKKAYPGVVRTASGSRNLYAIRSPELFEKMKPAELGKYYDTERALPVPKYAKEKK